MNIKDVLKLKCDLTKFYCEKLDIYLCLTNVDGVKSIRISDTLDNINDLDCPLLEQVLSLEDIFNLEVEPCYIYSIKDILRVENKGKRFKMLDYNDIIRIEVTHDKIPVAHIVGNSEDLIEDIYTLNGVINAEFVEVV